MVFRNFYFFLLIFLLSGIPVTSFAQESAGQNTKSRNQKPQKMHGCAKKKNFRSLVDFEVIVKPTRYDHRRTSEYLTNQGRERLKEWRTKHEHNVWVSGSDASDWHTQGVNRGSVSLRTNADLVAKPYDKYGIYYCPYVRRVTVKILYQSEIFIAKEIQKGSCDYRETLAHEEEHHDVNVTVVNTIAKRMEADMPKLIRMMEGRYLSKGQVDQGFEKLKQGISDALKIYLEEISLRRDEFNSLVDTPEEYKRLSTVCR
ncbi:MAG: hypothetical protein AB8B83_09830 [Bdellovibrionales bacterium]